MPSHLTVSTGSLASMKVPPKRKGNAGQVEAPNPITGMPQ